MRSRNSLWSPAQCFLEKISTSQKPRKPASSTQPPDLPDVDAALAGQPAIQQQILGGRLPVADVEGEQVPAAAAAQDLARAGRDPTTGGRRRPPRRREGDPMASAMSLAWPMVFTAERSSAYIGCSGSMASLTLLACGVGQHRLDAGADLIARHCQRLARHRPAHQHHDRARPARRPRRWPCGCRPGALSRPACVAVREEAAPAQRDDLQARPAQQRARPARDRARRAASRQTVMPLTPGRGVRLGRLARAATAWW